MTTTIKQAPPPPQAAPRSPDLASRVRLARRVLQLLLISLVGTGTLAAVLGYGAMQSTLGHYYQIVQEGSVSADAAQDAREALLSYHSAAADFLTIPDAATRGQHQAEANAAWSRFQEAMRRGWQNRSDELYGEFSVFEAADQAAWRYSGEVNAMFAYIAAGDAERAAQSFAQANETLVRRVIPALDGLERVKIENMEDAYARTSDDINEWVNIFGSVAGLSVLALLVSLGLTRFWLHYRWTWQVVVSLLLGVVLLGWLLWSLISAARDVQIMVSDAYETVSGVQTVKALITQADALESVALSDAANTEATLREYDQYIFLLEQRLCGERECWRQPFSLGSGGGEAEIERVAPEVLAVAEAGQSKYGLPRVPLIAGVNFRGEVAALDQMRTALEGYLAAHTEVASALASGDRARAAQINLQASDPALALVLEEANRERDIARAQFDRIWDTVRSRMQLNLYLTLLFILVGGLGAWGISLRRQRLYA